MGFERMNKLPGMDPGFLEQVYRENSAPVEGCVGINGEWFPLKIVKESWLSPRSAFIYAQMARCKLLNACYLEGLKTGDFKPIDPYLNVTAHFPAICIGTGSS